MSCEETCRAARICTGLLEREKARRQREAFVARANAQCTEAFCREAVRLNARLPVGELLARDL